MIKNIIEIKKESSEQEMLIKNTLKDFEKLECGSCGNIRNLIVESPKLLSTSNSFASELCVSNLFIEMMENSQPNDILNIFVDYIFNMF